MVSDRWLYNFFCLSSCQPRPMSRSGLRKMRLFGRLAATIKRHIFPLFDRLQIVLWMKVKLTKIFHGYMERFSLPAYDKVNGIILSCNLYCWYNLPAPLMAR